MAILLYVLFNLGLALLAGAIVVFVWAPMGLFTWFGLSKEAVLFHEGYRVQAFLWTFVFYVLVACCVVGAKRMPRYKALSRIAICVAWLVGLAGFVKVYYDVGAQFNQP